MDKHLMCEKLHHFQELLFTALLSSFNELRQPQLIPNSGLKITRLSSINA
jgi:hypothetical protein